MVVIVTTIGVLTTSSTTTTASAQVIGGGTPPSHCATKVHYLAYDAQHKGNFGPNLKDYKSVNKAVSDFKSAICTDPLFFAVKMESAAYGLKLDNAKTEQLAAAYAHNHKKWAADAKNYLSKAKFSLASYNTNYETIGMVQGANRSIQPKLVRASEKVKLGQSLDVTINNRTVHMRVACHFQEAGPSLPNLPTKATPPTRNVPPPHGVPTPPIGPPACVPSTSNNHCGHTTPPCQGSKCHTTPSGCVTPPAHGPGEKFNPVTCKWYKSAQSWDCQQNAGPGCPPNPAHQDPQSPGNKVQSTATKSVPGVTTAPSRQPTRPVDTGHPAPPTSGGNNGGGTSQPGTTAPPDTPVPSGTATGDPGGF